jgi:hypothetical protein
LAVWGNQGIGEFSEIAILGDHIFASSEQHTHTQPTSSEAKQLNTHPKLKPKNEKKTWNTKL